jgi:hypothetical protein
MPTELDLPAQEVPKDVEDIPTEPELPAEVVLRDVESIPTDTSVPLEVSPQEAPRDMEINPPEIRVTGAHVIDTVHAPQDNLVEPAVEPSPNSTLEPGLLDSVQEAAAGHSANASSAINDVRLFVRDQFLAKQTTGQLEGILAQHMTLNEPLVAPPSTQVPSANGGEPQNAQSPPETDQADTNSPQMVQLVQEMTPAVASAPSQEAEVVQMEVAQPSQLQATSPENGSAPTQDAELVQLETLQPHELQEATPAYESIVTQDAELAQVETMQPHELRHTTPADTSFSSQYVEPVQMETLQPHEVQRGLSTKVEPPSSPRSLDLEDKDLSAAAEAFSDVVAPVALSDFTAEEVGHELSPAAAASNNAAAGSCVEGATTGKGLEDLRLHLRTAIIGAVEKKTLTDLLTSAWEATERGAGQGMESDALEEANETRPVARRSVKDRKPTAHVKKTGALPLEEDEDEEETISLPAAAAPLSPVPLFFDDSMQVRSSGEAWAPEVETLRSETLALRDRTEKLEAMLMKLMAERS